jgi:predicted RNase H-like nuclease (RuvC/YqgF family)
MSEPREIWTMRYENSNLAIIRNESEKWPDDVDGKPNSIWDHYISYAAYETLRTENERLLEAIKSTKNYNKKLNEELEIFITDSVEPKSLVEQLQSEREKNAELEKKLEQMKQKCEKEKAQL